MADGFSLKFDARSKEILRSIERDFSKAQVDKAHAAATKFSSKKAATACRDAIVDQQAWEPGRAMRAVKRLVEKRGWALAVSSKWVLLGSKKSGSKAKKTGRGYASKMFGKWRVHRSSFWNENPSKEGRRKGVYQRDEPTKHYTRRSFVSRGWLEIRAAYPIKGVHVPGAGQALRDGDRGSTIMQMALPHHERKFLTSLGIKAKRVRNKLKVKGKRGGKSTL